MKDEDVQLGCDTNGNCAFYSIERKTFYALNPDGSPMGPDDQVKLLKKLGYNVRKKGSKVFVRRTS